MSSARIDFGMDLEAFLDITPRYFHALQKRDREKRVRDQEMTEVMGAQIVAMVRRCGMLQWKEDRDAKDFMPTQWHKQKGKPAKKQRTRSRQTIADEWRTVTANVETRRLTQ